MEPLEIAHLVLTLTTALATGTAGALSLAGVPYVRGIADRVCVPQGWMAPLGALLAAAALGLLVGLAVPPLGVAAATGLVLYFLGALAAHARARDPGVGGAVVLLLLAAGALVTGVAAPS